MNDYEYLQAEIDKLQEQLAQANASAKAWKASATKWRILEVITFGQADTVRHHRLYRDNYEDYLDRHPRKKFSHFTHSGDSP